MCSVDGSKTDPACLESQWSSGPLRCRRPFVGELEMAVPKLDKTGYFS